MLRDAIYRVMMRPWVYRITCLVIFIVLMIGVQFGIQAILENYGRNTLGAVFAICFIVAMLWAFWFERRRASPD